MFELPVVEGGRPFNTKKVVKKRACERTTAKASAACSLRQFSGRTKYRGASSGTPPSRKQSARFLYQIAQPSRPEPCAQVVRPSPSKRPVKKLSKNELAGRPQPTLLLPAICLDPLVD